MARKISNTDDVIDVRDVIARIEELQEAIENTGAVCKELATLLTFMDEMKGNGGDEEWRGDWYPIPAIRDSYFKTYAQELADQCGIETPTHWPYTCIDWDQAARELKYDYTSVEFDGVTYWVC